MNFMYLFSVAEICFQSDGVFITWAEMSAEWREVMEKMGVSAGISSLLALVNIKRKKNIE